MDLSCRPPANSGPRDRSEARPISQKTPMLFHGVTGRQNLLTRREGEAWRNMPPLTEAIWHRLCVDHGQVVLNGPALAY